MSQFRYPFDIDKASDYVQFSFGSYKAPIQGGGPNITSYQPNISSFTAGSTVLLNMPSDIGSNFTGAWAGKDTTSLAQFGLGAIASPLANTLKEGDLKKGIDSLMKTITNGKTYQNLFNAAGDDFMNYLGQSFSKIPGMGANLTTNDILTLTTGTILNPNTELLYGGPSLRSHGYSFKMIPRSDKEADSVLGIVETFQKACMPPEKGALLGTNGRNFIGVPDLVEIKFMTKNGENQYLPKYKVSALTSVSVNYVTEGNYMSYSNNKPIGIQLTVSLIETKISFREEYGTKVR